MRGISVLSFPVRALVPAAAALLAAGVTGAQQQITPLVVEGDAVPGVGTVTSIFGFAINDNGEWIVEADTDHGDTDADSVMLTPSGVLLREGQPLPAPAGATLDSFDSLVLNDAGESVWNLFLDGTAGTSDDSGIYYTDQLLIQESDFSGAAGVSPMTPYIGFFDVKLNNSGQALMLASHDDPNISSGVDQGFVLLTLDSAGSLVSETLVWFEGDTPPGQGARQIENFATGPHGSAFNDAGDVMVSINLDGDTSTDATVYLNNTLILQEGSPSPVAGRNWGGTTSPELGLNDAGDWVVSAQLDNTDTSTNLIIVRNGAKFRQEGDSFPAIGMNALTSFGSGPVLLSDAGELLWYGDWNDSDTDIDTGYFLDDTLLVQEGVTTVGASTIDTLRGITDGYTMSDNGRFIVFEAILDNGNEGAFLIDRAPGTTVVEGCFDQNPARLDYFSGSDSIGGALGVAMDGAPTNGELAVLGVAVNPITGFPPCGVPFPGIGEVLIDIINPGLFLQPMGVYNGDPLTVSIPINNNPALVNVSAWLQGLFISPIAPNVISLTNALEVTFQP